MSPKRESERPQTSHREVLSLDDFTDEDIAAIENTKPPPEAAQFDFEVEQPDSG
ncbi:MAG TPA: hypothetical protein VGM17_03000 [Rhizomicrobium sp.]